VCLCVCLCAAVVVFKGGLLVGRTGLHQFGAPHGLLEEEVGGVLGYWGVAV
jgi:hypothetical protein